MFAPEADQIEWLLRKKPAYLSTSPVNATALAYAISPAQVRDLGLEAILAYGETVLPLAREVVPERFGVPLIAVYSCQEVGYIATQCPVTTNYHVMAENVLVEILRDDGTPAAPGEAGQVVLTGFYNYAMPFIRYAIGDIATPGPEHCTCGLTLPVIAQVEGRTRHAFVFEDGARFWPRMGNFDISPFVACREFQLVQVDHRNLELRYVPADVGRAPDTAGLAAYVRDKIHPSVSVALVPTEAIPKGPGGKFTPFISMVES
jgi:phenylacetate-CoA ligase